MVNLSALLNIRADFLSEPERMLFSAVIISAALQFIKLFVPYLNGWTAVVWNLTLTAGLFYLVFGVVTTWDALAAYLCVVLIGAGIHGTVTKIADYPHPGENPTPSGTPRQNYGKIG